MTSSRPDRAGLILVTLIVVAAVANLNVSVANVALPDNGRSFDSSQTMLDLLRGSPSSFSPHGGSIPLGEIADINSSCR